MSARVNGAVGIASPMVGSAGAGGAAVASAASVVATASGSAGFSSPSFNITQSR